MYNKTEKINELVSSPKFLAELEKCENGEGVQALFEANGVEVSVEEIEQMVISSAQACLADAEELDDEDLEFISGGFALTTGTCILIASAALAFFTAYGYYSTMDMIKKGQIKVSKSALKKIQKMARK